MNRAFLIDKGITDPAILKEILDAHQGVVQDLKDDLKTARADLATAKSDLATAQKDAETAKGDAANAKKDTADNSGDDWKEKHDALQAEYDGFKDEISKKEAETQKNSLLKTQLEADGANPKLLNLIMREFDLEKLELKDGKISNWEDLAKPVKEAYPDIFTVSEQRGYTPAAPAQNNATADPFLAGFSEKQ